MPVYHTPGRTDANAKDLLAKYAFDPALDGPAVAERVAEMRKTYARERDQMLVFQKECGARRDSEGARFFKDESRHYMKLYRACCLLLPYLTSDYPGDCELRPIWDWPEELYWALDMVSLEAIYGGADVA